MIIAGELPVAAELGRLATEAGWDVATPEEAGGELPFLAIEAGDAGEEPLQGAPRLLLCADDTLASQELGGPAAGFSAVPPLRAGGLIELTRGAGTAPATAAAAERFAATLGLHVAWVGDSPGLVLARIVAALVNEAAFALGEGVARAEDIDDGMVLGLNHPRGPLAWADAMGIEHVVRVMDGLREFTGTDRYGLAPQLSRRLHEEAGA